MQANPLYLDPLRPAFFASISFFTVRRFTVLRECLDFFLGPRVVFLFAIKCFN